MRIDRLDLTAYGAFTDKSLDLSAGAPGLHLIYGDNEAGKSTSLRALIAWLFGIPSRTSDNYLHLNPQLRIGGKLRLSNGETIEFARRKGTKGTLLVPGTDNTLDDSILMPYLPGGIDESLFRKLYGIDHSGLVAGGQELLSQSGDLGQALFSAAVGTTSLREILTELQNSAEELFKPRASTKLINQSVSKFNEAQKRIKDSSIPVAEWKRLQKDLANTLLDIQQVEACNDEKNKEKSRLERLNRVKGALAERRGITARIEELGNVLILPQDFDEKRKIARAKLQNTSEAKTRAEVKLTHLQEESASLNVSDELLEKEELILAIHKELGAVEKTIKDRPQQDGKRRLLRNEAKQLLKSVRPDLNIDDSDQLRPLINNKKWISGLAQKHGLMNQKKENSETTLRNVEDEKEAIEIELNEQSQSSIDLSELKAAVAASRKAGDLEKRWAETQKRTTEGTVACDNELSRLGRFKGTIEELVIIPLPVIETLDHYDKQFDELNDKIKEYGRRQKELEEDQKQAEEELEVLLKASDVPTIHKLEGVRTERNKGWILLKQKYIDNTDVEKEIEEYASDSNLPVFYEQKVELADEVSDRMRLAADQVVKRANLEVRIEKRKLRQDKLIDDIRKTEQEKEVVKQEWNAIWESLNIDSGLPREMKQWLIRVDKLLSNVQTVKTISIEANKNAEDCKTLKTSISLQISKFDKTHNFHDMSLEAMINICEQRIKLEETNLERKHQLEQKRSDAQIRIKRVHEDLKLIESDQSRWIKEWTEAIEGLGLNPDIHPEQATETFDQLIVFFDKFDKSEDLRKRIFGMDQVTEKFNSRVLDVAKGIGFEKYEHDAMAIAAQLNSDLNDAREARASLQKIVKQQKEIEAEIEDADISIGIAQEQLAAFREQAGVQSDEDMESAAESSRKMRELRDRLNTLEQELMRNGDGLSIQELEKEASESDIDSIEGELEKVLSELKELQINRDSHRDQRQTLENEIKAMDGNAAAANASEEAEQQLATMVSGIEQYLRLQIAALILEQRIEDYRKKNQTPVLRRASEVFAKLTLGTYANLRDEIDENGKPILLGVRSNGGEVAVNAMSDGTRDQLYLSLRIATLEQHLSKGEPMPFVVDDILIGFDDNRTKICLQVLAELAANTQVLLFTHHRRVLELTDGIAAKSGVFIHELS